MANRRLQQSSEGEPLLTPAMFAILLSLAAGPRHGLGISDDVERRTEGDTILPVGTLYRSLGKLCDLELIQPARPRRGEPTDPRHKYFSITAAGRLALGREALRLDRLVRWARLQGAAARSV